MKTAPQQQVLNPASNWIEVSAARDTCNVKSSKFKQAYNLLADIYAEPCQAAALLPITGGPAWTNPPLTAFHWFMSETSVLFL